MLEELRDKNVKMLVGSNSGVAIATNSRGCLPTSILTVLGTIVDYKDNMVKISPAQIFGAIPGNVSINLGSVPTYTPSVENYKTVYVNINNIITIATIEE